MFLLSVLLSHFFCVISMLCSFLLGFLCWMTNDLTMGADWTGALGFPSFLLFGRRHGLGVSLSKLKALFYVYWKNWGRGIACVGVQYSYGSRL